MPESAEILVEVKMVVVPDGHTASGRVRLSLTINPNRRREDLERQDPKLPRDPDVLDLMRWPSQVAAYCANLRVVGGAITGAHALWPATDGRRVSGAQPLGRAIPDFDNGPTQADKTRWAKLYVEGGEADKLWRKIFGPDEATCHKNLAALADSLAPQTARAQTRAALDVRLCGYQTAELARVVDGLTGAAASATLAAHLTRDLLGEQFSGVPAAFDAAQPTNAWWLHQYATWLGQPALADSPHLRRLSDDALPSPGADMAHAIVAEQCAQGRVFCSASPLTLASTTLEPVVNDLAARGFDLDYDADLPRGKARRRDLKRQQAQCRPLARELHRMTLSLQPDMVRTAQNSAPAAPAPAARPADPTPKDSPASHRKLAGILSYPSLARFLRLIVDVEIDKAALPTAGRPAVTVQRRTAASLPLGEQATWTAYRLTATYFGPATRAASSGQTETGPWQDGLVNLRASTATDQSKARFHLVCDDVTLYVDACVKAAEQAANSQVNGQPAKPPQLPARQARGIAFVDSDRVDFEDKREMRLDQIEALRAKNKDALPANQTEHVRDLEDLLEGLRIDVCTAKRDASQAPPDPQRWRSLVARDLNIPDLPQEFTETYVGLRTRDDGSVRPMTRTIAETGSNTLCIEHHDVLFTWQGESLGVAGLPEPIPGCDADGSQWGKFTPLGPDDLQIDVEFAPATALPLPPPKPGQQPPLDRRPPPLRTGRGYYFGARLMLANGCGLTLDQAANAYDNLWLGEGKTAAYTYRRCQEIRAPELLLDWDDDAMVKAKELRPGDAIGALVVRKGVNDRARRFLTAAGVPFELAEQHAVFDASAEARPTGALAGKFAKAELHPLSGDFPVARGGKVEFSTPTDGCPASPPATPASTEPQQQSRGAVLKLDDKAKTTAAQLYPDPLGRRLRARLIDGTSIDGFETWGDFIEFWDQGKPSAGALPVNLELNAVGQNTLKGLRGRLRTETRDVMPENAASAIRLPTLRVDLEPGHSAELEIWSDEDPAVLRAEHEMARRAVETPGSVQGRRRRVAAAAALRRAGPNAALAAAQKMGPIALVNTRRRVTVTHAVPKPLAAPKFGYQGPKLAFNTVVTTAQAPLPDSKPLPNGQKTWAEYIAKQTNPSDPLSWKSEQGGATAFFVGSIEIHRLTTGRLRCEAIWEEHSPDCYTPTGDGDYRYKARPRTGRMFSIDLDPPKYDQLGSALDLTRGEKGTASEGQLRALSHTFIDGKARELCLQLVATSRFTNFYERNPDAAKPGAYDIDSGPLDLKATPTKTWVDCTFRPPPPGIERVLPIFKWTKKITNGRTATYTRQTAIRVYLKRDWFASGQGEKLGLVFPIFPGGGGTPEVCQFDPLGRYGSYLTRCGADPIHNGAPVGGVLTPDDVLNGDKAVKRTLRLAEPDLADSTVPQGPDSREVLVVGFDPTPPQEDGEAHHYVDIILRNDDKSQLGPAYFPFVQLGLVRYQPHCVDELHLSHPVAHMVQLAPQRTVRVTFDPPGLSTFNVEVWGPGFLDNSPVEHRRTLPTPHLTVSVMEAVAPEVVDWDPTNDAIRWHPVNLLAGQVDTKIKGTVTDGKTVKWNLHGFKLPTSRYSRPYMLVVEEGESLPNYAGDESERGPRMSRTISLGDWKTSNTDEAI